MNVNNSFLEGYRVGVYIYKDRKREGKLDNGPGSNIALRNMRTYGIQTSPLSTKFVKKHACNQP